MSGQLPGFCLLRRRSTEVCLLFFRCPGIDADAGRSRAPNHRLCGMKFTSMRGGRGPSGPVPGLPDLEGLNIYVYQPKKTLRDIERRLPEDREPTQRELRQAYDTVLRLRSQVLAALQDREDFEGAQGPDGERIAAQKSGGALWGRTVILSFQEPLPSQKGTDGGGGGILVDMLHAAFQKVAEQGASPFSKGPGGDPHRNAQGQRQHEGMGHLQRAIQVILNNLKGVFFPDDDMEHMAFAVAGHWAEGMGTPSSRSPISANASRFFTFPMSV